MFFRTFLRLLGQVARLRWDFQAARTRDKELVCLPPRALEVQQHQEER